MRIGSDLILVALFLGLVAAVAPAQQFLMETFDDNANGWTLGNDWMIGAATVGSSGGGGCNPDPGTDASGVVGGGVAGTNPGGPFAVNAVPGDLFFITSPVVDTAGAEGLLVEFQRWANLDYFGASGFMDNRVEVFDGTCWVRVATYGEVLGAQPNDTAWQTIRIDASAYANANFRLRIGTEVGNPAAYDTCNGWNIDNVRIQGTGVFYENFDDNSAGWTLEGDWEIGAAMPGGAGGLVGFGDPGVDGNQNLGGGVAGVLLGGDPIVHSTAVTYLTSPVIDTTGLDSPTLTFNRWLNSDFGPFAFYNIEVFDGSSWTEIWTEFDSGEFFTEDAWAVQTIDLTPYSNANLRIRWGFEIGASAVFSVSSWNVDNVAVYDAAEVPLGQAPNGGVALDVNDIATSPFGNTTDSGDAGPYYACVAVNTNMRVEVVGVPDQPWVLLLGELNVGASPIPPFGQIDLGTGALQGLTVIGSGLEPGVVNSFFRTGESGQGGVTFFIPAPLAGATFGLQGIMVDPAVQIRVTNAVDVLIVELP